MKGATMEAPSTTGLDDAEWARGEQHCAAVYGHNRVQVTSERDLPRGNYQHYDRLRFTPTLVQDTKSGVLYERREPWELAHY